MPDTALGVGDGEPQRELRQALDRGLGGHQFSPAQDEPHLRPVAVGDQHPPAVGDQVGHLLGERGGPLLLARNGTGFAVEDQGVSADGHQRGAAHRMSDLREWARQASPRTSPPARDVGDPRLAGQGVSTLGTEEG
ncbi:hypothetical protein [Geodermatophilus sp. CPCC 205761]|uniref:hypothetical protein n=1 Tax=Geodermatophilus sp. CPCC 205761 TaxID=2936597 RepID=UPI003EE9805F